MKKMITDNEWFGNEASADEYIEEQLAWDEDVLNYKKEELGDGWLVTYTYLLRK